MADKSDDGAIIDRLYDALAAGDVDAADACLAPDAVVWLCHGKLTRRDEIIRGFRQLVENFSERGIADVRREVITDGYLQRHVFFGRMPDGTRVGWAVCQIVRIVDGLIARIDEYIDRAGKLDLPEDGPIATPEFGNQAGGR